MSSTPASAPPSRASAGAKPGQRLRRNPGSLKGPAQSTESGGILNQGGRRAHGGRLVQAKGKGRRVAEESQVCAFPEGRTALGREGVWTPAFVEKCGWGTGRGRSECAPAAQGAEESRTQAETESPGRLWEREGEQRPKDTGRAPELISKPALAGSCLREECWRGTWGTPQRLPSGDPCPAPRLGLPTGTKIGPSHCRPLHSFIA